MPSGLSPDVGNAVSARAVAVLLAALLLGGCGTAMDPTEWLASPDVVEPSELVDLDNKVQPRQQWSRDIGVGTDNQRLNLVPRVVGDTVYVADGEGRVLALQRDTGRERWSVDLDLPVTGGPGAGDGVVLLGTANGEVVALNMTDGGERWRSPLSSEVLSVPAISNGTVIVHTVDGKLFGLEATTGTERWRYEREVPVLTLRGSSSPVVVGTTAYVGMPGGKLIAVRVDNGGLIWEGNVTVPTGRSELQRLADVDGDPVIRGGGVFVATFQGDVAALTQDNGRLAWRREMSTYSGVAAGSRYLVVADADGVVWALEPRSGEPAWSQDALKYRKLSAVALLGDLVVVGDFEGYLHWLNSADGALMARTRVGRDPISTGVVVVDDVLYVLGDGGDLHAIRLPGGG